MNQFSDEFARIADAERWLCEEAGPVLDTIVRSIERRAGVIVGEFRVTFDRTHGNNGFSVANCTIVQADVGPMWKTNNIGGVGASRSDESPEVTLSPNLVSRSVLE